MLKEIPATDVDLNGKALAVRYKKDHNRSDLFLVNIYAYATDADRDYVRRSELSLITIEEKMTADAMRTRVQAEAKGRKIERVAWIEV